MGLAILALGTAVPPHSISQTEAAEVAGIVCARHPGEANALAGMYKQTGIDRRHMVFAEEIVRDVKYAGIESGSEFLPDLCAQKRGPTTLVRMERYRAESVPLALAASRAALGQSGRKPEAFRQLITVSCTGFAAPGVDVQLIKHLGLPPDIARTHIGFMGCHGAINGLRVAQAAAECQPGSGVLLCCVELCSIHYHYGWDPKKMVANSLFADGAAALAGVAAGPGSGSWQVTKTGSFLFPDSEYAMTWTIGDYGFEMTLSTRVPSLIAENLKSWLAPWLLGHGLRLEEIGSWAVHPGGPRILDAVEEGLGLNSDALAVSREVLAEHGNMSSPTILFVLDRMRKRQAPRPCVALSFGPGLVVEAALIT
jgi:predicted naringenin-chalcone synthase